MRGARSASAAGIATSGLTIKDINHSRGSFASCAVAQGVVQNPHGPAISGPPASDVRLAWDVRVDSHEQRRY
jgi:hypothetical protein